MESLESFGVIQTFVNLPLFFLSGALFPLEHVPKWLQWFSIIDPLTYGVDALRTIILKESWTPLFPIELDILVILAFDGLMIIIGTLVFNQRK
jgi:ABC-2 type transport system permease protein